MIIEFAAQAASGQNTTRDDKNMKKTLIALAFTILVPVCAAVAGLLYMNNRTATWPERDELAPALEAGIDWMTRHREAILKQANPVLWWMVQQSAERTGDPRLQALFADYAAQRLGVGRNLWVPLFYPGRWVPFSDADIAHFPDYNLHFIYAISCDSGLADNPVVQSQLDPGFCDRHPWRPACATHQLMGFRFMQINQCGDSEATRASVSALQSRIVAQLTWDPRVVDVYVQRVLMLIESGAADRVKPVWLRRVLDAQRPDGGWAGVDPLISAGELTLGFGPRGLSLKQPRSDFHASAQGLLLLSLLTHPE